MAIKTKKISDLVQISVNGSVNQVGACDFDKSDFYVLACKDSVTGKLPVDKMFTAIRELIDYKTSETNKEDEPSTYAMSRSSIEGEETIAAMKKQSSELSANVTSLSQRVDVLDTKIKNNAFSTVSRVDELEERVVVLSEKVENAPSTVSAGCDCAEKIAALEAKVAALEGFVQALQAEGYLTLANIKKAAAEACPICTHTHEEEQSAE